MYTDEEVTKIALNLRKEVDSTPGTISMLIVKASEAMVKRIKDATTPLHYRDRGLGLAVMGAGMIASVMDNEQSPNYMQAMCYGSTALYGAALLIEGE